MAGKAQAAALEVPEVVERALGERAFSVEKFVESFPALVGAAGGIDRVKGLVIEIAVRGRLCRPTENDEPVDRQLARILQEKAGGPRKKAVVAISTLEPPPFDIPPHWQWIRWGDLVLATSSGWSPQCENRPRQDDEWGVLKVSAVSWLVFQPEENKALPMGVGPRVGFAAHAGDFLMSRANTADLVGRSVIVSTEPKRLLLSDKLVRCTFSKHVEQRYVNLYNRTATARAHYLSHASGTSESMKNISREAILSVPVPLPPLAEQKRIVARVDQLMALIDQLEAKQNRKRDLGARFTKASLEALTTAESPQSLSTAWTRLHSNWPTVLDCPDGVAALRQSIIDLTLRGAFSYPNGGAWPEMVLGNVIASSKYGTSKPCSLPDDHLTPVLRIPNVVKGALDLTELKYARFTKEELSDLELAPGDVLVVRSNGSKELVGRASIVDQRAKGFAYAGYLIRLRVNAQLVCPEWVRQTLTGSDLRSQIERPIRTTSGVHNINTKELLSLRIFVPSLAEQQSALARLKPLLSLCDALEAALRRREDRAAKLAEAVVQEMVA